MSWRDFVSIRSCFRPDAPEPDRSSVRAPLSAVLIGLVAGPEGPEVLYTKRSDTLRTHAGEVSFPGGRVDPDDVSPLAAALREAEEEVGLAPSDVEVLGHLCDHLTYRDVLVCAYVGALRVPAPRAPRSVEEVAEVFTVPLARLLDPAVYEGRRIAGMPRRAAVHYWHVEPHTVWGITGELTARFLERACGWVPPSPARTVSRVDEFRPAARVPSG